MWMEQQYDDHGEGFEELSVLGIESRPYFVSDMIRRPPIKVFHNFDRRSSYRDSKYA